MNRMWEEIMLPIIKFKNIKLVVEVGAEKGINTKNILNYCLENDAKLISIDPEPMFDVNIFKEEYGDYFTFYKELSLERLPLLKDYDCILIDGDHNWYTVYHELQCISETFNQNNFPLIFLHDVSWPYGRRDLYYNPDNIPKEYLNDYSQLGMHPDSEDLLSEYGLNTSLFNANKENTPRNGVLTAVEDFLNDCSFELEFHIFPMFFGLGIIHQKDNVLSSFIRKILCGKDVLSFVELFYLRNSLNKDKLIIQRTKLISEIKNKLSDNNLQLDKLNAENFNLKDEVSKLEEEFNHNNNLLDSLNQINVFLTKNSENQLNEINSLKDDLDNYYKFIKILKEQNKILESLSKKQENEILDLNKKLDDYDNKLNEYELELSKKNNLLNQLNEKCDSLSVLNSYLNNVNNSQSDEINQLKVEKNYFKRVVDTLSEENLTFKAAVDNQSCIINDLKYDFDLVNDKLIESDIKLKDYKLKYSEKAFDLNQANYKINRLFKRNNRLMDDNEEFSNEIGMLNERLGESEELIFNLNNLIEEKQMELDNLKDAFQNTVTIKYNLEQENAYLKNSIRINSDKRF